jgi:hypothetical protein
VQTSDLTGKRCRAMHRSTQLPSVSVIQSRAQPSYARIEPSRKVLRRKSRITIFAELADQLAEVRRHNWLVTKQAPQTFPYLSANGLIVLCVNVQFTHVCMPMRGTARVCLQFGNPKPDKSRSRAPEKCRR